MEYETVMMTTTIPLQQGHGTSQTSPIKEVQAALNTGKIRPDQVKWAEDYFLSDPESFKVFISKAIPFSLAPASMHSIPVPADETQRRINQLMGVDDETIQKNSAPASTIRDGSSIDETQRRINQLMGVDDETFMKYSANIR